MKRGSSAAKTKKPRAGGKIDTLLANTLESVVVKGARQIEAWRDPTNDISRVVKSDYVRSLRKNLDYWQVRALMEEFGKIFPAFNTEPIGMGMTIEAFAGIADKQNFHLKASPYKEAMALRGFYVAPMKGLLKDPLIYINTAYQELAVRTTFCHELGHHVTSKLFGAGDESVHFFFDSDYASHLNEPAEMAADIMVSFAGYPAPIAKKIFETPWDWGLVARAKNLTEAALNEVRGHLKKVYGFDLMESIPTDQIPHYLSGMIHYAKLRWALLVEYDL